MLQIYGKLNRRVSSNFYIVLRPHNARTAPSSSTTPLYAACVVIGSVMSRPDLLYRTPRKAPRSASCSRPPPSPPCARALPLIASRCHAAKRTADTASAALDLSAASFAYGDHHSDIPILSLARHAVAVNASGLLRKTAGRRGWELMSGAREGWPAPGSELTAEAAVQS